MTGFLEETACVHAQILTHLEMSDKIHLTRAMLYLYVL